MTSKERMMHALRREVPDRLPATVHQWQPYHLDRYLGGMTPLEKFRVVGTASYNEIRNMRGLKGIYDAADKHAFDAYDVGEKSSLALSRVFQKAHPGLLQLYLLFIVIGVVIFLLVI